MEILLDNKQINTYKDLLKTIQSALYTDWGKDKIAFVSAYPKSRGGSNQIDTPIITYRCRKTPGQYGNDVELKPRERGIISVVNDDNENVSVKIMGQLMNIIMTFEIWGGDGEEADQITDDFEKFMATYAPYFIQCGVQNMIFLSRDDGQDQHQWRSELIKRTVEYRFTIDQIASLELQNIQGIQINTAVYSNIYKVLTAEKSNINEEEN